MGMTEPPQSALLRSATLIKASVAVPHPLKKNTGQLIQLNRHLPKREKKQLMRRLGTLGMLLEALDQQGSENAVHIPFILCFRRFIVFLKQRAKFNKNLLTRQGEKIYIPQLFFAVAVILIHSPSSFIA